MIHQELQEFTYSIKQDSFFDLVSNDLAVKNTLFAFYIIGIFACFFNNFYLVLTMMIFSFTAVCALYLSPKSVDKQVKNIIENKSNNKYMLNIGTEIKKFYGDAVKSGKKITYDGKNINAPLPISKYMPKLDFFKMMNEYENYKLKKEAA